MCLTFFLIVVVLAILLFCLKLFQVVLFWVFFEFSKAYCLGYFDVFCLFSFPGAARKSARAELRNTLDLIDSLNSLSSISSINAINVILGKYIKLKQITFN